MQDNTDYLTVNDIARRLSVSPDTVRKWIRDKKLKAYQVGDYRINKADFDEFMKKRATIRDGEQD